MLIAITACSGVLSCLEWIHLLCDTTTNHTKSKKAVQATEGSVKGSVHFLFPPSARGCKGIGLFLFAFISLFRKFHVTKSTCSVFSDSPPAPCVYSIFERLINKLGISMGS